MKSFCFSFGFFLLVLFCVPLALVIFYDLGRGIMAHTAFYETWAGKSHSFIFLCFLLVTFLIFSSFFFILCIYAMYIEI